MRCLEEYLSAEKRHELEKRFYLTNASSHERRVLQYALLLFDRLSKAFRLGEKKKNLLHYSALLHDIGYEISPQKHDTHTRTLLLDDPFFDILPQPERTMLALIAGGHRKKMGKEIHQLSEKDQLTVKRLAAILRIADAIDYPRDLRLEILETKLTDQHLELLIRSSACATVAARVMQKAPLFQEVFDLQVRVIEA